MIGNSKKALLVVIIAGIGDLVLASKSVRAIKNGWPKRELHILTSTAAAPIAKNYQFIDYVWEFPIRELRKKKSSIFKIIKLVSCLRKTQFDIIINLYQVNSWIGTFKMGLLFSALKARERIGHNNKGFGLFVNKKLPLDTFKKKHFADAMMDIAILAGGKPDDNGLEVSWDKGSEKIWQILPEGKLKLEDFAIGLNPGGDRANRRWSPSKFATLADSLVEQFNAKIIILGGPGEEKLAHHIQNQMTCDSINLAGKLTINELVYIINRLDLFVTNDSGPMHISTAAKTPTVAIFGPENVDLLRPHTESNYYRTIFKNVDCRPCTKSECSEPICLELITPVDVLEKCLELKELHNL